MGFQSEYQEQKKIDEIVWRSLPSTIGYWFWFVTTIYLWHFKSVEIDFSATIGLGIGILTWFLAHLVLGVIGINLIHMNLWDNCGCGCFAKVFAIPLLPYIGILTLSVWAYTVGSIGLNTSIITFVIGCANWLLLTYLEA